MRTDTITAAEAARLLGVKPDTISRYVKRGYLTPVQRVTPRLWLYSRAEVEALRSARPPSGRPRTKLQEPQP